MNSNAYNQLLTILRDGNLVSGKLLGKLLSLSRTAIWKKIQKLKASGLEIQTVKGKGYRLSSPLRLFDKTEILKYLPENDKGNLNIDTCISTDSTNCQVRRVPLSKKCFNICVADHQYEGRGRRGRKWESPLGANCYYSILWKEPRGITALEGLSLMTGLTLLETLENEGIDSLELKWPNDILFKGHKLAGILVEIEGDLDGDCQVVAGVGVNMNIPLSVKEKMNQPITDLFSIKGTIPDKNYFVAQFTAQMIKNLTFFEKKGFKYFQKQWNDRNAYRDKCVTVETHEAISEGKCLGVDKKGSLLVQIDSKVKSFCGGEISVRCKQ